MDNRSLAIKLAQSESEKEVISILKKEGYWDNKNCWKLFGKNENNFSTIGNQSSAADAALVEKLINSVDAVLMKECLLRGIDPESSYAPQSISEALQMFYGIRDGKLSNLDTIKRNSMSYDIILAATGTKQNPNYVIVDKGEGQTPSKMPDTILSLGKSNKLRIPFVQGKFNMGGTGVLQFCGKNNLQLIITKKCPDIVVKDETKDFWGVTIVRRENPSEGRRSSTYTYLTDASGNILTFQADFLKIIPTTTGDTKEFTYGMFIKLFEYNIPGYRTNILFDLNYRLALLMPNLAHPVRLLECRGYGGHTLEATLSGLNVRLTDDKRDNVEIGFPISLTFDVEGDKYNASIYVFKEPGDDQKSRDQNYRKNEGVVFSLNGQTHGSLSKSFFKRNTVNLSYLADSLLIIVDCSNISGRTREDLFMNSRDRLRESELKRKIEGALEEYLKNHEGLKALQEERRRKAISRHLNNEKPLAEVLNDILKRSPSLSRLFLSGQRLQNPFNLAPAKETKIFNGKKHPTYFTLINKSSSPEYIKYVPINHKFRITFETDVVNDYFDRDVDQGKFQLLCMGKQCSDYGLHLYNGIASLTVKLPAYVNVKDILKFEAIVSDDCIVEDFRNEFTVVVINAEKYVGGHSSSRKNPSSDSGFGNGNRPSGLALPVINEVFQNEWDLRNMTKVDALTIMGTGKDNVYDFYINMDNIHLKAEIKNIRDASKVQLIKARYKYSMVLIGLSIINFYKSNKINHNEDFDFENYVKQIASMLSPIILPLIDSLGDLNLDEILSTEEAVTV